MKLLRRSGGRRKSHELCPRRAIQVCQERHTLAWGAKITLM
jgi:hypothetical protein